MSDVVRTAERSARNKTLLFWASFLALAAAGFGFAFNSGSATLFGTRVRGANSETSHAATPAGSDALWL